MSEIELSKAWYVLHTYSGYENKVKQNLESRATSMGMEHNILQVLIPEEQTYEEKDGETKVSTHKTFPGYVLVEMIMSDDAWYIVRNTPGVTGFVGSHGAGSKPSPLLPEEVDQILRSMGINPRKVNMDVEIGERVKIINGAFSGMEGTITEIESEKGKIKALVEMFGRETNAELDYDQISKVKD
ncbi:transcription termination/antitermination protein NusG [Marinilactibacillus sp. XAAS-LB27]|uniref:transcription termination/antitermination protein NusG n=1 Tax=Marinilactibacillus sp. XAAS-LB27 TaxID=3114538 RepID=UPI002E1999DE|nr:transcription termination/antitermination protein NusG [Marinilactibacillus sp. XAAS-LB27]